MGGKTWILGIAAWFLAAACGSPDPTAGCVNSPDCPAGQICQQGTCVLPSQVACSTDAMCVEALAGGSWKAQAAGECQEPRCVEKICKIADRPSGAACSGDGQSCTQDVCDGQGKCSHSLLEAGTCMIGGACAVAGQPSPANVCLACDPSSSTSDWSNASKGAPCKSDDLSCTIDQCNGKGKCTADVLKPGNCLVKGATGAQTCVEDGAAVDPAKPCEVCDASNPTAIKSLPDGAPCKGDVACKVGTCSAGQCDNLGVDPNSCLIEGVGCTAAEGISPKDNCLHCDPKISQTQWSFRPSGAKCDADTVPCTDETCDGAGACTKAADHGACKDKSGPCTEGQCDSGIGCVGVAKGVTATCEGDGVPCTVENCDGQGVCGKVGKATDSLCDDKIACTLDKCDPAKGCVFEPQDVNCADGNACTADKCDAKTGCVNSNLTDGTACVADELDCTTDACSAGLCKASIKEDFCVIASKCQAVGATSNGGCKSCSPKASQLDWTNAQDNTPCTDDGIACSTDTCAAGSCNHAPQHSKCDDGTACTADLCDLAKGCQNPDACPWGHGCDKTANACLTTGGTDGKGPVQITSSSVSEPNPTNPSVFRHGLDGGGQRTWIAWQSDSCMEVVGGAWVVKKPARLLAMPLDPQLVAPAQKVKPQAITLPVAKFFGSSTGVCQAFAQAANDPLVPNQAWLAWLEADPSQTEAAKACLGSGGQGGVMRVARLDGKSAAGSVEVAGEVCTLADEALFLTPGLALLDGSGADLTNINLRGLLSVRPTAGSSLAKWGSAYALKAKSIGDAGVAVNIAGLFAKVRPVAVDLTALSLPAERFLALGVEDDGGLLSLRGAYVKADGTKGGTAQWTSASPVKEVFANATAVCSIDATVNPAGTLGIVVVLRKASKDLVVLITRAADGTVKAEQLAGQDSQGNNCRVGIAGARIAWTGSAWLPLVYETLAATVPFQGSVKYLWANSVQKMPLPQGFVGATLDNTEEDTAANSLAWRGLARPVSLGAAMSSALETVNTAKARSLFVWTWLP